MLSHIPASPVGLVTLFVAALLYSVSVRAADALPAKGSETPAATPAPSASDKFFSDGSWGGGLAVLMRRSKVINDASVVNGTIRVNDEQRYGVKLLVTRHWYVASDGKKCKTVPVLGTCFGPFLSVGLGGNQGIDMVGAGVVLGFGNPDTEKDSQNREHNIGIGFAREFHVKVLGDGFSENSAPPTGETQIRYKFKDVGAPFLFYTHRW